MPAVNPGANPALGYGTLVGNGATFAGIDQGIDFTGSFPVYALGNAIVTRIQRTGSGWPGEGAILNYKLTSGPGSGRYVYVAEDFAPRADLRVGSVVKQGDTLGQATGSGKAPGIEVGWARPDGLPLAPRPAARPADQFTAQGQNFRNFVVASNAGTLGSINSAARHIPGVAQVEGAVGAAASTAEFIGRLTDPAYILRGLQVVAGGFLILVGIYLLARQVGLAPDAPSVVQAAAVAVPK